MWRRNGTTGRSCGWAGYGDEGFAAATPGARSKNKKKNLLFKLKKLPDRDF